jgi:hypothetical protein
MGVATDDNDAPATAPTQPPPSSATPTTNPIQSYQSHQQQPPPPSHGAPIPTFSSESSYPFGGGATGGAGVPHRQQGDGERMRPSDMPEEGLVLVPFSHLVFPLVVGLVSSRRTAKPHSSKQINVGSGCTGDQNGSTLLKQFGTVSKLAILLRRDVALEQRNVRWMTGQCEDSTCLVAVFLCLLPSL